MILDIVVNQASNAEFEQPLKLSPEYNSQPNSISLGVKGLAINPDTISTVSELGFEPKDESHVTFLRAKAGKAIAKAFKVMSEEEIISKQADIHRLLRATDFSFTLKDEILKVTEDLPVLVKGEPPTTEHRESMVQMIDMPGAEDFYAKLSQIAGVDLAIPPLHITLGTRGSDPEKSKFGIGIDSTADLQRLKATKIE